MWTLVVLIVLVCVGVVVGVLVSGFLAWGDGNGSSGGHWL